MSVVTNTSCLVCGADSHFIGALGSRSYFRCTGCGADQSISVVASLGASTSVGLEGLMSTLTKREMSIVKALVGGKSTYRVADDLQISTHTVRNHMKSVYRKLDVHCVAQLMAKVHGTALEAKDGTQHQSH